MPKRTNKPGITTTNRPPRGRGFRGGRGARSRGYGGGYMRRPRGGYRGRGYYSPYWAGDLLKCSRKLWYIFNSYYSMKFVVHDFCYDQLSIFFSGKTLKFCISKPFHVHSLKWASVNDLSVIWGTEKQRTTLFIFQSGSISVNLSLTQHKTPGKF